MNDAVFTAFLVEKPHQLFVVGAVYGVLIAIFLEVEAPVRTAATVKGVYVLDRGVLCIRF